jgi:hypothetical protein
MINFEQEIEMTWINRNQNYYECLGYKYTFYRDKFMVKFKDLPVNSQKRAKIICDYCGCEYNISAMRYNEIKRRTIISKDACVKCQTKKLKETLMLKYGVDNIAKLDFAEQKRINTNLIRYGSCAPSGNPDIYQKIKNTRKERYGVEHIIHIPEIKHKIQTKKNITYFKNGTVKTSRQQKYICNILNGVLNYPIGYYSADMMLNNNIILEYNGSGHYLSVICKSCTEKEFEKKELMKRYYFKDNGYNLITIESRHDYLPCDEIILDMIKYAKQIFSQGRSWIVFDIDENIVKYRYNIKPYDYGGLRKISSEDIKYAL